MPCRSVFIVIDGNSIVHRAYHALPMFTDKNGQAVGAVYGFALALFKAVKDFQPDYIAACFDTKKPTFRHKDFKEYKAKRPAMPPDLVAQLPKVEELLNGFGVARFALEGYEADDLIATAVARAREEKKDSDLDIYILTGDYDSLQLVNGATKAYIITRGVKNAVMFDGKTVEEKFGVKPDQIVALKALAGDASDNVPGAKGIGGKTAAELLRRFGSLLGLYKAVEAEPPEFDLGTVAHTQKIKKILLENKETVMFFEKLIAMKNDAPVDFSLNACKFSYFSGNQPKDTLLRLGFTSLIKRLPERETCRPATLF